MLNDRTIIWWNEGEMEVACFAVCDTKEHAEIIAEAWEMVWKEKNACTDDYDDDDDNYEPLDLDFIEAFLKPFGVELIDANFGGIRVMTSF